MFISQIVDSIFKKIGMQIKVQVYLATMDLKY